MCVYECSKIRYRLNGANGGLSEYDKNLIIKEFKPFYKEDNIRTLQIISEYASRSGDSINIERAIDRGAIVADYLVTLGMNKEYLKLRAVSSEKTIGFSYRLINGLIVKE